MGALVGNERSTTSGSGTGPAHARSGNHLVKIFVGIAFSGVFLYLALQHIEWNEFSTALKGARYSYLVPVIALSLFGHYLRAYRWSFMLRHVKKIGTPRLFSATMIGYMANNLLPARLGELVRAYALGRIEGISTSSAFATIVYERIVDVFALLVLLWISLIHHTGVKWLQTGGYWILAANVLLLLLLFVFKWKSDQAVLLIEKICRRLPSGIGSRISAVCSSFLEGLEVLSDRRALPAVILTSIPVWLMALLAVYVCFGALSLDLPYLASVLLIVLISLGSMIPSAPAFIGTTQYACVLGLGLFGVSKASALAFSVIYHATQFLPVTVLGFFYLWRNHIHLGEITRGGDDEKK